MGHEATSISRDVSVVHFRLRGNIGASPGKETHGNMPQSCDLYPIFALRDQPLKIE